MIQNKNKIGINSINEFIESNKTNLKIQQRLKGEGHNVYKIALSSNDDKRMQPIDLTEANTYGTSKDLVSNKEGIKCNNITKSPKND